MVVRETRVNGADILGRSRDKLAMRARRTLYRRLREEGYSYPTIGRMVGRDHTTVMSGVKGDGWLEPPGNAPLPAPRTPQDAPEGVETAEPPSGDPNPPGAGA